MSLFKRRLSENLERDFEQRFGAEITQAARIKEELERKEKEGDYVKAHQKGTKWLLAGVGVALVGTVVGTPLIALGVAIEGAAALSMAAQAAFQVLNRKYAQSIEQRPDFSRIAQVIEERRQIRQEQLSESAPSLGLSQKKM